MDFTDRKLGILLNTLSEEEWAAARWFLDAPAHKNRKAMLRCFDHLRDSHRQSEPADKQALFTATFPEKTEYDDDLPLRRLMSEMSGYLENFLAWRQLKRDQNSVAQLVLDALRQRNAEDLFHKKARAHLVEFQQSPPVDAADFQALAELHRQLYFHSAASNYQANHASLFQAIRNLEISFALRLLCYRVEVLARQSVLADDKDSAFCFESGLEEACRKLAPECAAIDLFVKLLALFSGEKNEDAFQSAWEAYLRQNASQYSFEQAMAHKILLQHAIAQSNAGGLNDHFNVLNIYKIGLERKLLEAPETALSVVSYLNISFAAALAEEFDWAANFEKNYKDRLPEKLRQSTLNLCQACLLFYYSRKKGTGAADFDRALDLLQDVSHEHELFELCVRTLQMRIFYEHPRVQPGRFLLNFAKNFERHLQTNRHFSVAFKTRYVLFS
ncbi:MAG: hypothetical protein AAB316_17360, partial [Bacteroidota bacterium]